MKLAVGLPSGMLERIPRVQRLALLIAVILVGSILGGILVVYTPWQQRRQELENQYSEELQRANILSTIKGQEEQLVQKEKTFLLEKGETPALTSEVTRLAAITGVAIESVIPQNEVKIGSYIKLQIRVIATASFPDLIKLTYAIEKHQPFLKIDQLEVGDLSRIQGDDIYRRGANTLLADAGFSNKQKIKFLISAFAPERPSR